LLGEDPAVDAERSAAEANRRARAQIRRYCAANGLNRLGTLTYAGEGCHDPRELRSDVGAFFRALRVGLGDERFPYLWVGQRHPGGHGLHVHFAVGRFVNRTLIEGAWGRGFVHIKLLGDLPVGSSALEEARLAARYISPYVSRTLADDRLPGLHRYEVAQGFQPKSVECYGPTADAAIASASKLMGGSRPMSGAPPRRRVGMGRRPAGQPGTDLAAQARAWVDASCQAQGLPVKLNDPRILTATAALLAKREKRAA